MMILCSFLCAYWLNKEFEKFTFKINRQVYQDYSELHISPISFPEFLAYSKLKNIKRIYRHLFYWLFPFCAMLFNDYPITFTFIIFILIYLSLLDYHYYLTDSHYIFAIFLAGLAQLLFYHSHQIAGFVFSLFSFLLFFAVFIPLVSLIFRKEAFGMGDVLLILALTPLFSFEQMISVVLLSTISGLFFAVISFYLFQKKLDRLPFIPFITFSTFIHFLATLPYLDQIRI